METKSKFSRGKGLIDYFGSATLDYHIKDT